MIAFLKGRGGPRTTLAVYYLISLLAVLGLVYWLGTAVVAAQAARGIRVGFDFLLVPSGFQIAESLLSVGPADPYLTVILAGLCNTVMVAAIAIPLATLLGTLLGLARLFAPRPLARAVAAYVELFRNTPILLQLFVWYGVLLQLPGVREALNPLPGVFLSNRGLVLPALAEGLAWVAVALAAPLLIGLLGRSRHPARRPWQAAVAIGALAALLLLPFPVLELGELRGFSIAGGWTLSPELAALTFGLVLFHAAYIAEVARAAVLAVPMGQIEAAKALGLKRLALARFVVAPGARRIALPPLANQYLALIKNSSLAVAIGYPDLMAVINTTINQTGQAIEASSLALGIYLAISLAVAGMVNLYHARADYGALTNDPTERLGEWLRRRPAVAPGLARRLLHALLYLALAFAAYRILDWALLAAVWRGPPEACAAATGACWAVLAEKQNLLLFGTLPVEARPRALLALGLLLLGVAIAVWRRLPLAPRGGLALLLILAAPLLLHGALFGLRPVPVVQWGGVVVTILLAVLSIGLALLLAVPLALARRSANPALRAPATALIEAIRGVPLVVLLFVTASVLPLVLGGLALDKMWLVLVALTAHATATLAEVWRGALAAVPEGQAEGAAALGLSRWQGFRLVVWPQARRIALPPAVGTVIGAVKDTSLVVVIGVFDVLGAAKAAVADTLWHAYALEVYLAVAAFYFAICFSLSLHAERLRIRAYRVR